MKHYITGDILNNPQYKRDRAKALAHMREKDEFEDQETFPPTESLTETMERMLDAGHKNSDFYSEDV